MQPAHLDARAARAVSHEPPAKTLMFDRTQGIFHPMAPLAREVELSVAAEGSERLCCHQPHWNMTEPSGRRLGAGVTALL
jgi:hypothetical protein